MKINPYIQVQQMYNTKKAGSTGNVSAAGRADGFELSSVGKDLQTAKQAVANTPDIREDMTMPIKQAVANGSYEVSSSSFADKLMKAYDESL